VKNTGIFITAFIILLFSLPLIPCEPDAGQEKTVRILLSGFFDSDIVLECVSEPFFYFKVAKGRDKYCFLLSREMGTSQTGYNDLIHLGLLIDSNADLVEAFILSHSDTEGFIEYIKESGFFSDIRSCDDISKVDAISGATLSCQAIKSGIIRTLNRYRDEVLDK